MSDYSIKAQITADASGYENGVKKAEKASKKLSTSVSKVVQGLGKNGLVGALGAVGLASSGLSATLGTVVKVARKVSETMNECTEAYKTQLIAERALNTAIQNNPFVTGASADSLKQFASEMQRVSNYGDEELIPMMANLVSLGRTETETMQIMSVAMDMSAGMGISLDTAITQLNATLNGNIGRLGQQNAELKELTDEELKQGKAIEILGEKFKGFSSATADTSKQLKNIKGDFKEAIGQFTLPSSDMWNRFWAGFYQNGIDVINRFNDYLDIQIIGKKILENLQSNAKAVANATGYSVEDILSDFRYLKEQLEYLSDSEIRTLQNTLEKQKDRTESEERMLTIAKQIMQSRKQNLEYEKQLAEEEAKKAKALAEQQEKENGIAELKQKHLDKIKEQEAKWENIKKVTGEEVSLEEKLKFYQDDLVAIMTEAGGQISTNNQYYKDQMALINSILSALGKEIEVNSEWQNKLHDQRIELLEDERDKAIQYAESEGKETYSIWRDYNEKILELKLERLEREKSEALGKEGVTAEDKVAIEEYYSNETKKVYSELGDYKKKKGDEEKKNEKSKFDVMLEYAKRYAEKIKDVFSKVVSTIKTVFSTGVNIFKKLFEINPDEILNNVLKVEDSILTFFTETLPKMPSLVENIIKSIVVLAGNVRRLVNSNDISKIVTSILNSISSNLPQIVKDVLATLKEIINGVVRGLADWVGSGGWKVLLDLMLEIQKTLEEIVVENIDEIADLIAEMLPDLVDMLVKSIVSASKTLGKIIKPVLRIVGTLIEAILKVITSQEVINASIDAIGKIIEAIVSFVIGNLVPILIRIINAIVKVSPQIMPKLIDAIINGFVSGFGDGLANFFQNIDWKDVFKTMVSSLEDIARKFIAMLTGGLSEVGRGITSGSSGGYGKHSTGSTAGDVVVDLFTGGIRHLFADGTNTAPSGLAIVGEAGPELVRFRGGEQVLNNRNTNKALAEMSGTTVNQSITFNNLQDTTAFAMMNQLKQYNRQMAINGII